MKTSKSTLIVARMALRTAQQALAKYSHSKSPRKFTQPQLLACLIVKELRGLDYRGIQRAQTEPWQCTSCQKIPKSEPGNPSARSMPQPDDSQAYISCFIQSRTVTIFPIFIFTIL